MCVNMFLCFFKILLSLLLVMLVILVVCCSDCLIVIRFEDCFIINSQNVIVLFIVACIGVCSILVLNLQ